MIFNLFELHSKDDKARSWIWARLDSKLIRNIYLNLLKTKTQDEITRKIKNNIGGGFSTIQKHLIRLKKSKDKIWLPLAILIELSKYDEKLKNMIMKSIDLLKNYNTRPVRAIKEMNTILAKIIGAHIADGYLQKEGKTYKLKIVDERKDSIFKFKGWVEKLFNIKLCVYFVKEENCWYCWIRNKIIGRYFERIFRVPSGKKFDIAKEPEIIKKSSKEIRKAFALGVFMFDGGIKTTGMVALTTKSRQLMKDLLEILKLYNLSMKVTYNVSRKVWVLESKTGRNKKIIKKWLTYFEPKTWKYKRLDFFLSPEKYSPEKIFELFPENRLCKICLKNVYNAIEKLKMAKPKQIVKEIISSKNIEKLGYTTIYKYLFILNKAGLISKHEKYLSGPKCGIRLTIYNFNEVPLVR